MVKFNIFFESVQKFNERISKVNNYGLFNEVLINWTNKEPIQDIAEPLIGKDICIFRMDSYSLSRSFVFENVELLLKIFETANISEVYIHNPPKKFFNTIKQQVSSENVSVKQNSFSKISEKQVRTVAEDVKKI